MKITRSMIRGLVKEVLTEQNDYMNTPALSRQQGQAGLYPGDRGYNPSVNNNSPNDIIDGFVDTKLLSYLISNMTQLESEYGITKDQFIQWIENNI